MMRAAGVALLLCLTTVGANADTTDPTRTADVIACAKFTDKVTAMIRTGDTEGAQRAKPRLRECLQIQRMALDRAARILASEGQATTGR